MNVFLTGATGFVGSEIARQLSGYNDAKVFAAVRKASSLLPTKVDQVLFSGLSADTDYGLALTNIDVVIHAAARVHVMKDIAEDPLDEFRKINVDGTLNLALQAAEAGVTRFIFLSSIGVNGNSNLAPFVEGDVPHPHSAYSLAKYEAEQALINLGEKTGLEIVIIRPPLVYARHAPGNFKTLMNWMGKGVPLPLGFVNNKRSFVALDNLVSFIIRCIDHPKAANEMFLISDGEDVSTTELLEKVAKAFGKKALLIPLPVSIMKFAAKLIKKGDVAERLFGSLQVDSSKARDLLGWKPVITMDEQLKKMLR